MRFYTENQAEKALKPEVVGKTWHGLTEEKKTPYEDLFEDDKKRYHKEMADWKT